VGVDLSAGMLAHAKEKNVYDELLKIELAEYLRDNLGAFNLLGRFEIPEEHVLQVPEVRQDQLPQH
jgi:hypothetical protein